MQAKLVMIVREGRVQLMRPMDATPVNHHDDFLARFAKDVHDLMDILAQLLGVKVRHNFIEDARRPILDGPDDTQQDAARDPAPRTRLYPGLPFEAFVAFDLALAQRTRRQSRALRAPPPAHPGEGKTPQDRFIFVEQNDLTPACPILQSREVDRAVGEVSGGRSEPPRGTTIA